MKCHKPNTDQEAEFTVCANGEPLPEYTVSTTDSDPNVLESCVPVKEDDHITVRGYFTGSVLQGCFDLLIDGSYLADSRIDGDETGQVSFHNKRRVWMRSVLNAVEEHNATSTGNMKAIRIVEGDLHVKIIGSKFPVEARAIHAPNGDLGVGSIVIVCSVNQKMADTYPMKYKSQKCGDWQYTSNPQIRTGGVFPDFSLGFRLTQDEVPLKRQSKHKRHFYQEKFGNKPWAVFVFYYRSQEALNAYGCEKSVGTSRALEPGDATTFITAMPDFKKAKTRKKKQDLMDENQRPADSEDDDQALFVTSKPNRGPKMNPEKRTLFRQSLGAQRNQQARTGKESANPKLANSPEVARSLIDPQLHKRQITARNQAEDQSREFARFDKDFDEAAIHRVDEEHTSRDNDGPAESKSAVDSVIRKFSDRLLGRQCISISNTRPMRATQSPSVTPTPSHDQHRVVFKDEPRIDRLDSNQPTLGDQKAPSVPAIASDVQQSHLEEWKLRISNTSPSVTGSLPNAFASDLIKIEHDDKDSARSDRGPCDAGRLQIPGTPDSLLDHCRNKRAASTASRELTASKKQRLDQLSAQKAELLKILHERKQEKLFAQVSLAEQRRLREEEERKLAEVERRREENELHDIDLLQIQLAEETAELADLERMRSEEEEGIKEARLARARAEIDNGEGKSVDEWC